MMDFLSAAFDGLIRFLGILTLGCGVFLGVLVTRDWLARRRRNQGKD